MRTYHIYRLLIDPTKNYITERVKKGIKNNAKAGKIGVTHNLPLRLKTYFRVREQIEGVSYEILESFKAADFKEARITEKRWQVKYGWIDGTAKSVEDGTHNTVGKKPANFRPANIYKTNGELVAEGVSIANWAEANGLRPDRLRATAKGRSPHHKGHIAKYL